MADKDTILCTIYKGSREQDLYVFVPREKGEENIPDELRQRMGVIREVMTLELAEGSKLARAEARQVIRELREKGYYLQLPPEITGQVLYEGD